MTTRREVVFALGTAALCASVPARARAEKRVRRIAWLSGPAGGTNPGWPTAFRTGMTELKWVEGRDYVVDIRYAADAERGLADAGGLMSYGPNIPDNFRRAAGFVDKVLKGAKPDDLPTQQPLEFEMVVNMKTAKAMGFTIPPSVLVRANRVIE